MKEYWRIFFLYNKRTFNNYDKFCLQSMRDYNDTITQSIHVVSSIKCGYWQTVWVPYPHSWLITGFVTRFTRRVPLVEQELPTLQEHLSSLPVLSEVRVTRFFVLCACFVDRCLSFCPFSFGHCVVCSSSIYGLWLPLGYLQTLLIDNILLEIGGHIFQEIVGINMGSICAPLLQIFSISPMRLLSHLQVYDDTLPINIPNRRATSSLWLYVILLK